MTSNTIRRLMRVNEASRNTVLPQIPLEQMQALLIDQCSNRLGSNDATTEVWHD